MQNPIVLKRVMITMFILVVTLIFFSSCADAQHQVKQCVTGYEYGFFSGAWHGSVSPIAFVGSLFSDDISIYAINNNGAWYDFGYVLGLAGVIKLISLLIAMLGSR